jgi:hypothetical protein
MALNIKPSTSQERKALFLETLLNKTTKVSKISDNSVLAGVSAGVSKIAGKAEKDIVIAVSRLFPDSAYGSQLDQVAQDFGIAPRFEASESSTFLRLVGEVGTSYLTNTHVFSGNEGVDFQLENDVVIGAAGFTYAKVRSVDSGIKTNVDSATINRVTPIPIGHSFVTNEYAAMGGRDTESDDLFRRRIKQGSNILATGTLAMLEQVFMLINNNVLKIYYRGINSSGKIVLSILTQNGIDLSVSELDEILDRGANFFSLTELKPFGSQSYGIVLENVSYQPIDISFRCELFPSFNPDDVRKEIQTKISKKLDFRYFLPGRDRIEWDDLLDVVKTTRGIKYVADQYFYPNQDQATDPNKVPRLRGFLMLDLTGVVISSLNGVLSPVYYPQAADFQYQSSVLRTI